MQHKRLLTCILFYTILILGWFYVTPAFVYAIEPLSVGMNLPRFTLSTTDTTEVKYLGLKDPKPFTVSQIPCKLTIIEIFSLHCPICHKQAPVLNKLFKYITQNPEMSKDVKMIGIGAGNNKIEIGVFRNKYNTQFPLFTDENFEIHKKIGEPRTPFTIIADNKGKILLTHAGVIEDLDEFFVKIKNLHKQQR